MSIDGSPAESITVHPWPPEAPGFAARVVLSGEHDVATHEQLRDALGQIVGDLLIDLTECSFIDSTVIGVISTRSVELRREGHRLELAVPPADSTVTRVLEIVHMRDIVKIHAGLSATTGDRAAAREAS